MSKIFFSDLLDIVDLRASHFSRETLVENNQLKLCLYSPFIFLFDILWLSTLLEQNHLSTSLKVEKPQLKSLKVPTLNIKIKR